MPERKFDLGDYVEPLPQRFWAKVAIGDCWEWTGAKGNGYGVAWLDCHVYDETNTHVYDGRRYCRTCHLAHSRAHRERRRS